MMKAALLEDLNKITVREVPTPEVDDDSILVKVHACAVCGSDVRMFHFGNSRLKPPAIMGHEASGEVVRVGGKVTRFTVGDRVAIGADVPCGECAFCEAGMGNNCQINYAMGYQFPGSFAEYVLLNRIVVNFGPVHKIPDHVSFDEAALAEPLACVLNALELSRVVLGDKVVVMGAGPIGCMLCEVARMMGAAKVILMNRSKPRLDAAQALGVADVYVCMSEENPVERVLAETGGLGANVVITANPSPQSHADALHMAVNRGRVNLFGGLPKGSMVSMDTNIIHYKELFVHGAHGSLPIHHQKAVDLIASGRINIGKYASHQFPLERTAEAFAAAENKAGMRIVVHPQE